MIKRNEIITIVGGCGFLGSCVVKELAKTGARINVVARHASKHIDLKINGYVGQVALHDIDVKKFEKLEKVIKNSDYVVNLIGILYEKGSQTFQELHTELPKKIAEACKRYKVKKFVHVSSLGVDVAKTSTYANSKLKGERNIKIAYPNATILRPSVIFGADDNFTNLFNWMSKISPVLPLIGGGKTLFQPVYVGDVAAAIAQIIKAENDSFYGKTLELGGPEQLSFEQIIQKIMLISGRKRMLLSIPFAAAKLKARFLELAPKPLMTRDQIELLKYDNIVNGENGFVHLDIKPHAMNTVMATYLK